MILLDLAETTDVGSCIWLIEQVAEVQALRFPMCDRLASFKLIHATDHFFDGAETELRHDFAHLHRDEAHEVHCMLRLASVLLAQTRVLSRNTCRAGIEVTDAHHDATCRNQRCCREAKFLCTEERGDHDVAARL